MSAHSHGFDLDEIGPYATVAEFETPEDLVAAADAARLAGFKKMDAYSPFPVHGLSDAIGFKSNAVPFLVLWGGLTGGLFGYCLQYYVHVLDYPMNVGGKPLNSIPSMIPITYECTILWGGLTAFFSMIALNRLPKLYHSIFNTPNFERATNDRFFLAIEAADPNYEAVRVRDFLTERGALSIAEVEK
ncbi:DUF3341 domain-containing protein [soil metagenome]